LCWWILAGRCAAFFATTAFGRGTGACSSKGFRYDREDRRRGVAVEYAGRCVYEPGQVRRRAEKFREGAGGGPKFRSGAHEPWYRAAGATEIGGGARGSGASFQQAAG